MLYGKNPGRVVSKFHFSSFFKEAWFKAIKSETFIAGFRKMGVHPLDSSTISIPASISSLNMSK